jgi:hypothetical protein
MGGFAMSEIDDYRQMAAEALQIAGLVRDPREKAALIQAAQGWRDLVKSKTDRRKPWMRAAPEPTTPQRGVAGERSG